MKSYLSAMSTALLSAVSAAAIAASSIPAQAPDVPGNAGGGPVDCKQVPTDRNCLSMNPKNDSNSKAATDTKRGPATGSASYSGTGTMPQQANETPGPAGRKNDRVQ
jgi:hypothetical protein